MRRLLLAALLVAFGFGVVTLIALEGREVVVLETTAPDGTVHETRTWVADADGATWIEAANPERPFLRDLRTHPDLALVRGGRVLRCRATPSADADGGHARIRALLAARYGWADRWIALVADTRRSLAIRLDCAPA